MELCYRQVPMHLRINVANVEILIGLRRSLTVEFVQSVISIFDIEMVCNGDATTRTEDASCQSST